MAESEGKLAPLKAALRAFMLSSLECHARYQELETRIEAAAALLKAKTPDELRQLRDELRADVEDAVRGAKHPWSGAELDHLVDGTLKSVLPTVLALVLGGGARDADDTEHATFATPAPEEAEEPSTRQAKQGTCQRCSSRATFHITEIAGKEPLVVHLCNEHAREYLTTRETM